MNRFKSLASLSMLIAIVVVGGLVAVVRRGEIDSYEECIAAGYPMMKSMPPQCATPDGKVFVEEPKPKTYGNPELGISFNYPGGYFLEEREEGNARSIVLIEDTSFYRDLMAGRVPDTEGPPNINITIHRNAPEAEPLAWVMESPFSNFQLGDGKYEETAIAGKEAVLYKSDGLYQTDNVVISSGGNIVHLSVGYLTPEDRIREDFRMILDSLRF